jgi:pimeloyl-ACP methyl ester carboxylesterase
MEASPRRLVMLLTLASLATGCGLNTAVLQKGGSCRKGVLLNYSCGARPCDPIDPAKPTIVITHGWNPLPKRIHTTFGCSGAQALRCRCGDSFNILSWDWNGVKISPFNDEPLRVGLCQGRMMAAALRRRGVVPRRTQIIGHSLGTIVAAQAAVCLSDRGPMRQITLLDPPETYHEEIFCCLRPTRHACVVENYWTPGLSGYGAHIDCRGVRNYCVKGPTPIRGTVDLSVSNHVFVMLWYHQTMRCPSMRRGFQNSCLLRYCGSGGPCYSADESELNTIDSGESRITSPRLALRPR